MLDRARTEVVHGVWDGLALAGARRRQSRGATRPAEGVPGSGGQVARHGWRMARLAAAGERATPPAWAAKLLAAGVKRPVCPRPAATGDAAARALVDAAQWVGIEARRHGRTGISLRRHGVRDQGRGGWKWITGSKGIREGRVSCGLLGSKGIREGSVSCGLLGCQFRWA